MVSLLGHGDELLRIVEENFDTDILVRGNEISVTGDPDVVTEVVRLFENIILLLESGHTLDVDALYRVIDMVRAGANPSEVLAKKAVATAVKTVRPKSIGQRSYVDAIEKNTLIFAIGPAGTGKTYLAMAAAVRALQEQSVQRIVLTRPAVEAGEKLGFLPGDLHQKVDPYLRPLYDALFDIFGPEPGARLIERGVVEVAPLAYMRGRTLNDSFVILDEAQNTSPEQMKMFLTRLGFGSKMIVTGDVTQADLSSRSGLAELPDNICDIEGVSLVRLTKQDTVRHRIVREIVNVYEVWESRRGTGQKMGPQRRVERAKRRA